MHYRPSKIRRSATNPIGRHHDSVEWLPPEQWIADAPIPAVVTQQQFELAQAKLRQNQSFARRNNKAEYLLRALVSCGICRLACQARRTSDNKYYLCAGKNKEARQRRGQTCASRFIPAQQLDDLVWQDLCELLADPSYINQELARAQGGQWLPQELQARREGLRKAITSLTQQLNRLTDAYLGGVMRLDEYQRRRRELEQRQQALEQQAQQLSVQADQQSKLAGLMDSVEDFRRRVQSGLSQATFEQKRQLLELLVDRVVVTHEEVEIRYVIPTSPKSEKIRFCQLRSDYFDHPSSRQ
jgi:site-specific DNA recombinase